MRALEARGGAVADTFNAQEVANTLWAACVFSALCASQEAKPWLQVVAQRLVSLGRPACFSTANLCQLHQFFVWCRVQEKLGVEWYRQVLNNVPALPDACRLAFARLETASSVSQRQVSETLVRMGLSVEVEACCPTSGYSIDILVRDSALATGGERRSRGGTWAVEFDGPSHFLVSSSMAPTGATLLKRRHLHLLGHSLVSVPYWEWNACKGPVEREQYLRSKLGACKASAAEHIETDSV